MSTGAMPSLDPGFAAYVELLDDGSSFLAPSIRLGAEISANQGGYLESVRRRVVRLDACSFRVVLSRPRSDDAFTLEPCARIDLGQLDVQAGDGRVQVDVTRLWVAPAGLLRVRWTSPRLFVEFEGGVAFPLKREHFSGDVHDFVVPPIGASTGLGFGLYIL